MPCATISAVVMIEGFSVSLQNVPHWLAPTLTIMAGILSLYGVGAFLVLTIVFSASFLRGAWMRTQGYGKDLTFFQLIRLVVDIAFVALLTGLMVGFSYLLLMVSGRVSVFFNWLNGALGLETRFVELTSGPLKSPLIISLGVVISVVLFRLRARHRVTYGAFEVSLALLTMAITSQNISRNDAISTQGVAFAGAVYVLIRGFTNMYDGLPKSKKMLVDRWVLAALSQTSERPSDSKETPPNTP